MISKLKEKVVISTLATSFRIVPVARLALSTALTCYPTSALALPCSSITLGTDRGKATHARLTSLVKKKECNKYIYHIQII